MSEKEIIIANAGLKKTTLKNSRVEAEYVSYGRKDSIDVIVKLIENAKKIKIFHKPSLSREDNDVIRGLKKTSAKIKFFSNFTNISDKESIAKRLGNNVELITVLNSKEEYHRKEMLIDNVLVFGSLNFLTNTSKEINESHFLFENTHFWILKEGKDDK